MKIIEILELVPKRNLELWEDVLRTQDYVTGQGQAGSQAGENNRPEEAGSFCLTVSLQGWPCSQQTTVPSSTLSHLQLVNYVFSLLQVQGPAEAA